ncbi:MAG: bifunctional lysylphosphatidylglycerol flippase/synthetase MprF, partial [Chloroflexota bacterium]
VGEPIGPEAARLDLAAEFSAYCRAHGWLPAFYQVSNTGVDAYRAVGLRPLKIGEEAMIDVPSFTLAVKRIANVRHCVSHGERHGLRADIYMHGVPDEDTLAGVAAVSAAWLRAEPGRGEMGYSMGSFSRAVVSRTCTAVARDPEGVVVAFITFRQAGQGMVLDLMRRGAAAPPGTIDFLIARALERFRAEGVPFASLSLAPLANVRGDGRAPRVGRLLALVYEYGNGLYRYKSLYNFKKKFAPRWEPRYLLYPARPWALPRVALAVALVHMPKGVLRLPNPARLAAWSGRRLRGMLDWRDGLRPGPLAHTLLLMTVITLAASVPELWRAITLFGRPSSSPSYAMLSLALAAGNMLGALALARGWDSGRRLLTLGALGFFVQAIWGLAEGYVSGWLGWSVDLALAPIEAWMIWFLLQPEVRAHLRNRRRGAAVRERTADAVRMCGS